MVISHMVHLQGSVGDPVFSLQEVFEFPATGVAVFVLSDEDVRGEGREAGGNGPDVQVVDLLDTCVVLHSVADIGSVKAGGRAFEEDHRRVSKELPGAKENEYANEDANEGVVAAILLR